MRTTHLRLITEFSMNLKLRIRCVFKFSSKYHIPYNKSYVLKYVIMSCDSMKIYYKPFYGFQIVITLLTFICLGGQFFSQKKVFFTRILGNWKRSYIHFSLIRKNTLFRTEKYFMHLLGVLKHFQQNKNL